MPRKDRSLIRNVLGGALEGLVIRSVTIRHDGDPSKLAPICDRSVR